MLALIKQWLTAPVETTGGDGKRRMEGGKASRRGVPQGGVISPLVANLYMDRFLKYWRQTGRGKAWMHMSSITPTTSSSSAADTRRRLWRGLTA